MSSFSEGNFRRNGVIFKKLTTKFDPSLVIIMVIEKIVGSEKNMKSNVVRRRERVKEKETFSETLTSISITC